MPAAAESERGRESDIVEHEGESQREIERESERERESASERGRAREGERVRAAEDGKRERAWHGETVACGACSA